MSSQVKPTLNAFIIKVAETLAGIEKHQTQTSDWTNLREVSGKT